MKIPTQTERERERERERTVRLQMGEDWTGGKNEVNKRQSMSGRKKKWARMLSVLPNYLGRISSLSIYSDGFSSGLSAIDLILSLSSLCQYYRCDKLKTIALRSVPLTRRSHGS